VAAIAWTLFAFGGLYSWTLVPLAIFVVLGLLTIRPRVFGAGWALDMALLLSLLAVAAQLVPLSPGVRSALSPHAESVEGALRIQRAGVVSPSPQPLTISPATTALSLGYLALGVAVFWLTRGVLERGSARPVVRQIAWMGFLVSVIAVIQLGASPLLMYGLWRPEDASARPFGPFVNRNHMATWLLLAIPLAWGYVMTRTRARMHGQVGRVALIRAVDGTTVWQAGAVVTMVSTLFLSLSRSGAIGLLAAAIAGFAFTFARFGRIKVRWLVSVAAFVVVVATFLADLVALTTRFARVLEYGSERAEIWRQTLPIVRDFALTGTGEGTFSKAMLFYQQGDRQLLFNQAHNQYLQIAAEGGVLVGLPVLCGLIALAVLTARALRHDTTPLFWMRTGAAAGLVAVGVQSVWETGLRMPANGVLFALCAAVAVHEAQGSRPKPEQEEETRLSSASSERGIAWREGAERARGSGRGAD
jgi:O-antigen ligase